MRIVAGIFLLVSALLSLVIGGGLALSSRYEKFQAQIRAEDLSTVSEDLVSPEELAKLKQRGKVQTRGAGLRPLAIGVGVGATGLLDLVAGILLLLRRGRRFVIAVVVVSLLAVGVALALEGYLFLGGISLGLLTVAGAAALRAPSARPV
ncbi:MAG: hypothetical protein IT371_25030 [Deltaproteobacteria bacterium]|nr:hypothetical protein [Deltaproteobacteria bacterium]